MYREAWASEDEREQLYVVYFLHDRKDPADRDLLLEAVRSPYERVAGHAAATASGWILLHKILEVSDEVIGAFRTLAINHPKDDVGRWPRLRRVDGWPEGRPFVQLYERWMCDEFPRDPAIQRQLEELTDETWEHGDAVDRAYVLHFLDLTKSSESTARIIEGLKSDDHRLGDMAAFLAWCAIDKGRDFGPYWDRFPKFGGYAWYALRALDKDNPPPSIPRSYRRPEGHSETP
jgi:hypothetical protein